MEKMLKEKLWDYIIQNNPDLMLKLQEEYKAADYVDEKVKGVLALAEEMLSESTPIEIIEEICINVLTEDLKPSRFNYLCSLLRENFEVVYIDYRYKGSVIYEVIQIMEYCKETFDAIGFSKETEHNPELKNAIIQIIGSFINKQQGK